jgi:hypothetical protein
MVIAVSESFLNETIEHYLSKEGQENQFKIIAYELSQSKIKNSSLGDPTSWTVPDELVEITNTFESFRFQVSMESISIELTKKSGDVPAVKLKLKIEEARFDVSDENEVEHEDPVSIQANLAVTVPLTIGVVEEDGSVKINVVWDDIIFDFEDLSIDGHGQEDTDSAWRAFLETAEALFKLALEEAPFYYPEMIIEAAKLYESELPCFKVPGVKGYFEEDPDAGFDVQDSSKLTCLVNQDRNHNNALVICLDLSHKTKEGSITGLVNNLRADRDFSVVLNREFLASLVDEMWSKGVIPHKYDETAAASEDGNLEIHSLSLKPEEGFIQVNGKATIKPALGVGVDFEFIVKAYLTCEEDEYFAVQKTEVDISVDGWDIFKGILLGIAGQCIDPAIGWLHTFLIQNELMYTLLSWYSKSEEGDSDQEFELEALRDGLIPKCKVIHTDKLELGTAGTLQLGRYLVNTSSKEVHDLYNENPNCQISEIKLENIKCFVTCEEAFGWKSGLNGCYYCMRKYHTD